jgi:hypothetical protein
VRFDLQPLSPKIYNARSGLALVCPIANHAKGYPFEVAVPAGRGATRIILADHVENLDWKARRADVPRPYNNVDFQGKGEARLARWFYRLRVGRK